MDLAAQLQFKNLTKRHFENSRNTLLASLVIFVGIETYSIILWNDTLPTELHRTPGCASRTAEHISQLMGYLKRVGERGGGEWRRESQSQRAWRGQGSHWQADRKYWKKSEASWRGEWSKRGKEGEEKGERRERGRGERGVNLLEDINRRKRTWSLAVTLTDSHIHRSPLPFSSPPALLSTHLLQPFIHLEPRAKSVSSFYTTSSSCCHTTVQRSSRLENCIHLTAQINANDSCITEGYACIITVNYFTIKRKQIQME